MRAVAEYAMRGRTQAVTVAAISAAIPLLFWISAATIALVTLRRGWVEGINLLLWASLPAAVWLVMQSDPTPLLVIVGAGVLAAVLRTTTSWVYTLMIGVALGVVVSWLMPLLMPQVMADLLQVGRQILDQMASELAVNAGPEFDEWLKRLFTGIMGAVHLLVIIASLALARWWQAVLYNPGGFAEEFHRVVLPRAFALPMMLLMVFGTGISPVVLGWVPALSVPFLVAGIALVHGVVGLKKLSSQWLVAFYLLLFFAGPYLYLLLLLLAFLDSVMDFRQRIARNTG